MEDNPRNEQTNPLGLLALRPSPSVTLPTMAASNSNVAHLDAAIATLECLESDFRIFQGQSDKGLQLL